MNNVALCCVTIFRIVLWIGYLSVALLLSIDDDCKMNGTYIMIIVSCIPNISLSITRCLGVDRFEKSMWYIIMISIQIIAVLGTVCGIVGLVIAYDNQGTLIAVALDCHNFCYFMIVYCILEPFCIILFEFIIPYIMRVKTGYTFIDGKARDNESGAEIIPKYQSCSICLSDYETEEDIVIFKCQHIFHKSCIQDWTKSHSTCPCCRDTVRV